VSTTLICSTPSSAQITWCEYVCQYKQKNTHTVQEVWQRINSLLEVSYMDMACKLHLDIIWQRLNLSS
jgi:hypothetical protein